MADCGGLMIGVDSIEPKTPPLEMEKVPPVSSSIEILPSLAFWPYSAIFFDVGDAHLVGVAQDRHTRPRGEPTAMPMSM